MVEGVRLCRSLDVHERIVMSKQRRLSAFFGQQHKENTAETSMENDKAVPENDQSSEPKSKLPKRNFQQSWLEKYEWLKFDPLKGMFCSLCQKSKKSNPFTIGCANYRTSTLVHHIESQDHQNAIDQQLIVKTSTELSTYGKEKNEGEFCTSRGS